jgi:hypothetical protein
MTPISGKRRLQKPRIDGQEARQKLVYFDDRVLKLVERAARSLDPAPTSSYFIALAAEEKARAVLNIPA